MKEREGNLEMDDDGVIEHYRNGMQSVYMTSLSYKLFMLYSSSKGRHT